MDNNIHEYPLNDTKDHIFTLQCPCEPSLIRENGEPTVVHNPFDLRDFFSQDKQIINELYLHHTGRLPAWGKGGTC
jgi:hypothetical protein